MGLTIYVAMFFFLQNRTVEYVFKFLFIDSYICVINEAYKELDICQSGKNPSVVSPNSNHPGLYKTLAFIMYSLIFTFKEFDGPWKVAYIQYVLFRAQFAVVQ